MQFEEEEEGILECFANYELLGMKDISKTHQHVFLIVNSIR